MTEWIDINEKKPEVGDVVVISFKKDGDLGIGPVCLDPQGRLYVSYHEYWGASFDAISYWFLVPTIPNEVKDA